MIRLCMLFIPGADIYAVDSECRTPLHLACEKGHLQVSEMLLDKGNCGMYIMY